MIIEGLETDASDTFDGTGAKQDFPRLRKSCPIAA